ncbi:hypothetical protein KPL74_11995 [Bacillus sp. NP157]|nr:hypothetical protein KPL74_11995 [Bacillus sp. NP157]
MQRLRLTAALAALSFSIVTVAGPGAGAGGLPACTSQGNPGACRLPIVNGDFERDIGVGWTIQGFASPGAGVGVLMPGARLGQAVAINTLSDPATSGYATQLRVFGETGDGMVEVRLALSDSEGKNAHPIATTQATVRKGEWTTVDLSGAGAAFAAPAHVLLTIENTGPGTRVQVDDVHVVESLDAS